MFSLIRLAILCAVAFVAGVLYERHNQSEVCRDLGEWRGGICFVQGAGQ